MPDHSCSEDVFPNTQSKPPLTQLEAISSCPIASYLGEETNTCLTTTFYVVVESKKVPPGSIMLFSVPTIPKYWVSLSYPSYHHSRNS